MQLRLGNTQEALSAYQQSLEIRQALADADPANAQAQRDLMVSYTKMGSTYKNLDEKDKALDYYRKALALAEVLAQDELNQQAQDDLKWVQDAVERLGE